MSSNHLPDPIEVLVVDDNEQWVDVLASDIEREGNFTARIALSASEGLIALQNHDSIDCVVADYQMPEVDGIEFLEEVRESRPDLPFILLTGRGSEEVASRAIKAGVSDYFRKNPRLNQFPILANRIEQVVEQQSLQQELERSEERYRTITEQVSEAIVILRDGRVGFCNDRLSELTGYDRETLGETDFVDELVHPEDREAFDAALEESDAESLRETRLVTRSDDVVHCEYTVGTAPFEGETAMLLSLRDITDKRNRERNLQRERDLNQRVQEALAESRTRSDLESHITATLREFGYDLVWIGERTGSRLQPREIAGQDDYLEAVSLSTEDDEHASEPSVWTARTGRPRFTGDLTEMFSTEWRNHALDAGYRTAAALPIRYEDIVYGVLVVYDADPGRIDEQERDLLSAVSETLGFAIHHLGVKKTLSSPRVVDVELKLTDADYYLAEVAAAPDIEVSTVDVTVEGTHAYDDDGVVQYIRVGGPSGETFRAAASDHPAVRDVRVVDENPPRLAVRTNESPPELTVATLGGSVQPTKVMPTGALLQFQLASQTDLGDVVTALEAEHGSVTVRSCVEVERSVRELGANALVERAGLTEKQATALEAAYQHGYFEQPRKQSAKEIADTLDIVHSTYLQHLRVAQQKLFDTLYDH